MAIGYNQTMSTECEYHAFERRIIEITKKLTPEQKAKYEEEAEVAMRRATVWLLLQQPFFGLTLCDMIRKPDWSLDPPTLATDGVRIYYHPICVSLFSPLERRAGLCHEVLHLVYSHFFRRKGREMESWNVAGDYKINSTIKDECKEMSLPSWVYYDPQFKDMNAEKIYKILQEQRSQSSNGKEEGEGKPGNSKGKGKDSHGCPKCQKEAQKRGGHTFDEHREPKISNDEIMDKVIRAAEQASKATRGTIPASIAALIKSLREPKVDWRKFIRGRALDIFNRRDYHPEVRSLITGPVAGAMGVGSTWLPGLASEESRILTVVIDTSGSISLDLLRNFASELKGIMALADKTIVITADAAVHENVEVSKFDDILAKMKFRGGGGTDFRPAFKKIEEMKVVPELLVYFTDAEGTFPQNRPDYPVLWALTKHHAPVPWGESVVVPEEEKE